MIKKKRIRIRINPKLSANYTNRNMNNMILHYGIRFF